MKEEKYTTVSTLMDEQCNDLLNRSAKISNRSKRKEAGARLKHHLETFGADWKNNIKEKSSS